MAARVATQAKARGGVQSLDRAFAILEAMADAGGVIGLSQLAATVELPLATIHRLVRTLVGLGYVRQEPSRQYSLGPRLMRLADGSSRRLGSAARPWMSEVASKLGESVNLAVLDADEIVYIAQVQPSANFMRMFTEVGRRVQPHGTAVGKAILATFTDAQVRSVLSRIGMRRLTERTITTASRFIDDLNLVRERGYALDDGEQELGVRCVAVSIPGAPRPMALSASGPAPRLSDEAVASAVPLLHGAATGIGEEFGVPAAAQSALRP